MTKPVSTLALIGLLAALGAGCGRNFDPPPPTVRVEGLWPTAGYSQDPVALCASSLDEAAGGNRVFFGSAQAEVIGYDAPPDWQPDPAWSCARQTLFVRVPVAQSEGPLPLLVTNTTGQSAADLSFDYLGPGHPVASEVDRVMHLSAGLWGLFATPGMSAPVFGGVSHDAATLFITDASNGLHLDFGLCDLPLSAAAAVTDFFVVEFYVVTMSLGAGGDLDAELKLFSWRIDLLDLVTSYRFDPPASEPLPATGDGEAFLPGQVWSVARAAQPIPGATLHDVAVSHALQPALMLLSTEDPSQVQVIEWPAQAPHCAQDPSDSLGPIADLVFDAATRDYYVALQGSNEIWRLDADSLQLDRVWPPAVVAGHESQINCASRYSALALRRSHSQHAHLRLYAADTGRGRIQEFQLASTAQGEIIEPTLSALNLDALPYALTTGLYHTQSDGGQDMTGERLYAMTQNGIVVLDVSAVRPLTPNIQRFDHLGEIPLPSNRGGPQSLVTNHTFTTLGDEDDTILAADAAGDLVRMFTVGGESLQLGDITIGASLPRLVPSAKPGRIYATDVLSNTIQVIDSDAGLRRGQFPIAALDDHDYMGFGSTGLASLREDGVDLILTPLLDVDPLEREGRTKQRLVAYGRIDKDLPACGLSDTGLTVDDGIAERYDTATLVRWDLDGREDVPLLVLNRLADRVELVDENGQPAGERSYSARTWCRELDPAADEGQPLIVSGPLPCELAADELAGEVRLVAAARDLPAIARLTEDDEAGISLHLTLLPRAADDARLDASLVLEPKLADFIGGMLVAPSLPGQTPAIQVYLPLTSLGRIGVASFPLTGDAASFSYIDTGGDPIGLALSPDGRRLFASHTFLSRLDVLRRDCGEQKCQDAQRTLDVGPWPHELTFDDTGRRGFLVHLFSHDITVIE